jgi:hypothetical protein
VTAAGAYRSGFMTVGDRYPPFLDGWFGIAQRGATLKSGRSTGSRTSDADRMRCKTALYHSRGRERQVSCGAFSRKTGQRRNSGGGTQPLRPFQLDAGFRDLDELAVGLIKRSNLPPGVPEPLKNLDRV